MIICVDLYFENCITWLTRIKTSGENSSEFKNAGTSVFN